MIAARPKLVFAHQLRGVSVLIVLLVHYTIVVQVLRRDIAWVAGAPPLDTPFAPVAAWLNFNRFDIGTFAVAVFFLISGFVIPFALEATTVPRFLLARAFRIFPVFWVALLIGWIAVHASAAFWHGEPAYGVRSYLVNGLLIETLLGEQTVDWVSWTLSIEVKFYLLAALLRPWIVQRRVWPLLAGALFALMVNMLAVRGLLRLPVELVSETTYLAFICTGILFNYHFARALPAARLALAAAAIMALVAASWALGPMLGVWTMKTLSMAVAVLAFTAAYFARRRFQHSRLLDFFAAISYPLYLVHAVFGFTVMSFLIMAWHVPYAAAAPLTFGVSVAVATAVHYVVELPSTRLGSHFARAARTTKTISNSRATLAEAARTADFNTVADSEAA